MKDIICNAHYSPTYHYDWILFTPMCDKEGNPMKGQKRTERLFEICLYNSEILKIYPHSIRTLGLKPSNLI